MRVWLITASLALVGCDGDPGDRTLPRDGGPDRTDAGPPIGGCAIAGVLEYDRFPLPEPNSDRYEEPSAERAGALRASLEAAIAGDRFAAAAAAAEADYVLCVEDTDSDLLVWWPMDQTGQARIALRLDPPRDVIVEVPHPLFDTNTDDQGLAIFEGAGARALIVGGGHRCASTTVGCEGSSSACDRYDVEPFGGYRLSDPAHATGGTFHLAHVVLAEAFAESVVLSVHGFGSISENPDAQAILSNGTTDPVSADAPVARLAETLGLAGVDGVVSCNGGAGVPQVSSLCGTTNVQGRQLRGSPDACFTDGGESRQRFVHLEQTRNVRDELRENVISAVRGAF